MLDKTKLGHRERLRDRFLAGDNGSRTEETLLELLLCYSIPQKDVQPLARKLLTKFGNFSAVLSADPETLCDFDGIKIHSAVLLKLVNWIRSHFPHKEQKQLLKEHAEPQQKTLFKPPTIKPEQFSTVTERKKTATEVVKPRRGTELFGKAVLKEAITLLPKIPETESLSEVRQFLRNHLHFSAEQTRQRYANYIVRRLFPDGHIDKAIKDFSLKYRDKQELRDVCFYRFCKAEPLMLDITSQLLIPNIGNGKIIRIRLKEYLSTRFPASKSITDCCKAIIDALKDAGIVKADRTSISFSFREILIPSFAFVLHSEFPEPAMYDISKVETNRAIRSMLWNPDRILPLLYELRNTGLISKISEIDNVRQFTTKFTLEELVAQLSKFK
ncbi:MAG: DNA repair protein [Candidatus Brocadia sp.]|nr:DNA repair protein [Candidatus Brocadia sp.]